MKMLLILLSLFFLIAARQYACRIGSVCLSNDTVISRSHNMIVYTIYKTVPNNRMGCMARGKSNLFRCSDTNFTWYNLGFVKQGNSVSLYIGDIKMQLLELNAKELLLQQHLYGVGK